MSFSGSKTSCLSLITQLSSRVHPPFWGRNNTMAVWVVFLNQTIIVVADGLVSSQK